MSYFLMHKFQSDSWMRVDRDKTYPTIKAAWPDAEEAASKAMYYGMVAIVADNGEAVKVWGAGAMQDKPRTQPPADLLEKFGESRVGGCACGECDTNMLIFNISVEESAGSDKFNTVLSLTPLNNDTAETTLGYAMSAAEKLSVSYPHRKVMVSDSTGKTLRIILYTPESDAFQQKQDVLGGKDPKPYVTTKGDEPAPLAPGDDDDMTDFEGVNLVPPTSRVSSYSYNSQVYISISSLDALFMEMQLNNFRSVNGCEENEFLLETLRKWLTKVEQQIRGGA